MLLLELARRVTDQKSDRLHRLAARTSGSHPGNGSSILPGVTFAGVAQLVERQPSKLNVDGSNPFIRFEHP